MNVASEIILTKESGIATILLNRPEKYNAFTTSMVLEWKEALTDCREDESVKVIVLTGAGTAFCSGGDVNAMGEWIDQSALERKNRLWNEVHTIPKILYTIDKPIIAAINGMALGAGLDMALMCDLRIASDKAKFAEAYVKVGLVPGDGGAYFLPRLVGLSKALELLWSGKMIDAAEAEKIGLVNMVVSSDILEAKTYELAQQLANGPSIAIRAIKRAVYKGLTMDLDTHLDYISSLYAIVTETDYHQRAIKAFGKKSK